MFHMKQKLLFAYEKINTNIMLFNDVSFFD